MGRGAGKIIAGAVVAGVGIALNATGVGVLAGQRLTMLGASLMLNGIASSLNKVPTISQHGYDTGANSSNQIAGMPIPYGRTGVQANLNLPVAGTEGQPVFGIVRVSVATLEEQRYLWVLAAVCHGPVASIDTIYLDGRPALVRTTGTDGVPRMRAVKSNTTPRDWQDGDYRDIVAAEVAYGTDGQRMPVPNDNRAGFPLSVTNSTKIDSTTREITVSASHPWDVGDCVRLLNVHGVASTVAGYNVVKRVSSTVFQVRDPAGAGGASGSGGTADYWAAAPYTIFAGVDYRAMGEGIVYVVLRCTYDEIRFPNGVPNITVGVSGIAGVDPRTSRTLTIATTSDGGSTGGVSPWYDHVPQVQFTGAHGLSEGDIIEISGTGTIADGIQRVDRVVNSTTIKVFATAPTLILPPVSVPTTSGGTAVTRATISNPIIAIRDYLTNPRYGVGVPTTEIDDTQFTTAANYCDALVYVPDQDTQDFANSRTIIATSPGANTTLQLDDATGYNPGDAILIQGTSQGALNVRTTVASFVDATHITVPIATAASGSGGELQRQIQQARFQVSGILDSSATLKDNLEKLCLACRCTLIYQAGKYYPTIRQPTTATMTLTQDHIIGGWSFRLGGQDELVNVLRGTFINPARGYQLDQTAWPLDNTSNGFLVNDAGQISMRDVELTLVDNVSRVHQILMVLRRESRIARQVSFVATEAALQCAVGDLVNITHETPGWTAQPHWVTSIEPLENGTVAMTCEGYDATSYDLDATDDVPFSAATDLPVSFGPAVPLILESATRRGTASALDTGYLTLMAADSRLVLSRVEARTRVGLAGVWSNWTDLTGPPYETTVSIPSGDSSAIEYRAYVMGPGGVITGLNVVQNLREFAYSATAYLRLKVQNAVYDAPSATWTMWYRTYVVVAGSEAEVTAPWGTGPFSQNILALTVMDTETGELATTTHSTTYDSTNHGYTISWSSKVEQTWDLRLDFRWNTNLGDPVDQQTLRLRPEVP